MRKVLVTGVAGFIGSHLATRFIEEGYKVIGVDDLSTGERANVPSGVELIIGDLANSSTIDQIPKDCSKVLHLAGQSSGEISFDDPVNDLKKNTISTLNLIQYCLVNDVERLVYASSMSVYGEAEDCPIMENHSCKPLSCYGVGKRASEAYLRVYQKQLPFVSMRMFNVYGPGQDMKNLRQGMVSIYLSQALSNGLIEVKGSLDRFRDFIFLDDVVELWFRASFSPKAIGQFINVGTGVRTSVSELLQKICELVPGTYYFVKSGTPGDQSGIYAETSNLKDILGMNSFVPLEVGLKEFVAWAQNSN